MKRIEQLRAQLADIVNKLSGIQASAELTEEQIAEVNGYNDQVTKLSNEIEALEKLESMQARVSIGARKTEAAPVSAKVEGGVERVTLDPKRGFKSQGEFYSAVIGARSGNVDPKLIKAGLMEKFGEDGGFLVPEDFRSDIQKKVNGDQSLLARCRTFTTASNNLTLPTYETAPWDSSAGFQAYWEGEASSYKESKAQFSQISMRLHKLTALVKVTEEIMEDAPLLDSWVRANAPEAMLARVNSAIINGTGAGMPQGILRSGFKIKVAKEVGQAADSFVFENSNKMLGALAPLSLPNAVWIVNPGILPLLRLMTFGTGGSNPVPAYLPSTGVSGAPYGTLYGLPIMPMMGGVKAVGDEGDIMLADLNYYYAALKTSAGPGLAVKSDISTHVYFATDESALKFSFRMAGQVPYKAPIVNEAGDFSASGIITLADRA